MMKKLLLNFIASVFCFFLAVVMVLAAEYTDATDNLTVEWLAGDGTDIYNLTGDNVVAIRSVRGHATVNITGTGSRVVDNCSDDGCPTQYFNGQFADTFSGADGTTLAQHYPPWYGVRWPSTASNCVITGGVVACNPVLGDELVTNGDFSSDVGWTAQAGWAIGTGVLTGTTTTANTFRTSLTIGKWYLAGITSSSYTGGTVQLRDDTGTPKVFVSSVGADGIFKGINKAGGTSYVLDGVTAYTGVLDDATAKEVIWSTFLSNVTDYKFKTEVAYSIDMTVADGDMAGIAFKVGDLTAGSEDFCAVYLNKGTGKVELMKVVGGAVTTPLSAAVTYSAGATLKLISADGIKWIVVYNGSQVGTEQTLSEASLDSSVAGFFATSASTTFDNWKAGRWQLGSELVTNGDGESLTGWNIALRGDLSSVSTNGAIGNCFKLSETSDTNTMIVSSNVVVAAGKTYIFSVRVKAGSAGLKWADYLGGLTAGNFFVNPSRLDIDQPTDALPSEWTKYSRVINIPVAASADVTGAILLKDSGGGGASEYSYRDEISVREIQ